MKIVITGIAGFIGSNLASFLLKQNSSGGQKRFDIVGIDDLSYGLINNIPKDVEFHNLDIRSKRITDIFKNAEVVFHFAAKNCISDCQIDPVETADINVGGTVNIFEAARKASVRKVVYAESSAIYEGSKILPTPETENTPESFYASSKAATMLFASAYRRYYSLNLTALRYFCVYGPVQDYRRTVPPIMSAFIIKLLKGERPIIYGTGEKKRDFVFVDDINEFHLKCINDPRTDNDVFNIGSGNNYSVNDVFNIICDIMDVKTEPEYRANLPGEAMSTLADISKAKRLGWEPKTNLRDGILLSIEYLKNEIKAGRI